MIRLDFSFVIHQFALIGLQELDTDGEASSIEDEFDDGDSIASADDLDGD